MRSGEHRVLEPGMMSAAELVRSGTERLQRAGIEPARSEAEWLMGRLLGVRPLDLYFYEGRISEPVAAQFADQVEERASGMPLQYVLGEAEFFGRVFEVAPGVFIPRPETETVVEEALGALRALERQRGRPLRLVEFGTGSGCIAVTLAHALPTCAVVAVELSWLALRVAQENVRQHGLASRVHLVQGSWDAPLRGRFDGIISNPPYVPSVHVDQLPLDVRQEPRLSLDGGSDGLRDLRQVMTQAKARLAAGGVLVLECGEEQVEPLTRQAATAAWVKRVKQIQDLSGRPRGLIVTRGTLREGEAAS